MLNIVKKIKDETEREYDTKFEDIVVWNFPEETKKKNLQARGICHNQGQD